VRHLLDHLVGTGEDRLRQGEAERLGGLEVDRELEMGRLLHGQLAGRGAAKDTNHVIRGAPAQLGKVGAITEETPFSGHPVPLAHCRQARRKRLRGERRGIARELGYRGDRRRLHAGLAHLCKG
jgi:hypothetical protein